MRGVPAGPASQRVWSIAPDAPAPRRDARWRRRRIPDQSTPLTCRPSPLCCREPSLVAFENVTIHDPAMLVARAGACDDNLRTNLGQTARHEDLAGHAEIGAPPDVQAFRIERLKRSPAVQHHDDRVHGGWPATLAQAAPGRDKKG